MYLGSQLFINPDDTPEQIQAWVKSMAEHNLTMIRLFMVWDQLEPREGDWVFENYDACFDAAAQNRMIVVPTLMSVCPPGWMGLTQGPQSFGPLEDHHFWKKSLDSVLKIVERYARHPSLNSWILWNEPDYTPPKNQHTLNHFKAFLEKAYEGDVDRLNSHRFQPLQSFEELCFDESGVNESAFASHSEAVDWIRFCEDFLVSRITDLRDAVRQHDTVHPCHVNPHNVGTNILGQNLWLESDVVDFLGCSAHPPWHSTRYGLERLPDSIGFFANLIRGASPYRHWVSELQGGSTLYSADHPSCPTPKDITLWLAECLASGAEATLFWCFNTRNNGFEAGEWGLLGPHDRPTPRLKAAQAFAQWNEKHHDFLESLKPPEPDAWILVGEDNLHLSWVEGKGQTGPRNEHAGLDAVAGAYFALTDLGFKVGFMNESQLAKMPPKGKLLVLPNLMVLSDESLKVLDLWFKAGVPLVADGWLAPKDPWGKVQNHQLLKVEKLFGFSMLDFEGLSQGKTLHGEGIHGTTQWARYVLAPSQASKTLATHDDGRPAVNLLSSPEGKALAIGTHVFSEYLEYQETWRPLLSAILSRDLGLSLPTHPQSVSVSLHPGPRASLMTIFNRSQEKQDVEMNLDHLEPLPLPGQGEPNRSSQGLSLAPKEVRFFKKTTD